MVDEELPYEYQLDEIATRVNKFRADGIPPELFLMPTFLKYFPVAMEPGVLPDVKWNSISGLFMWSPVLPMTYVDNDILLAMSHQQVWDVDTPESFHPRCSLAIVKHFPAGPMYMLTTVYVPATQDQLHFLPTLSSLHSLQMEAVALVYVPKSGIYMPEPSSGDHYTLLLISGGKNICIGALLSFVAARLTVGSKYGGSKMGVHLKLPPSFGLQLDGNDLITKSAFCCSPIWKNADFMVCGEDKRPLLVNGDPVAMETPIKVAPVDQFTPVECTALTNVGYEHKFTNDAFSFRETVTEMWQ